LDHNIIYWYIILTTLTLTRYVTPIGRMNQSLTEGVNKFKNTVLVLITGALALIVSLSFRDLSLAIFHNNDAKRKKSNFVKNKEKLKLINETNGNENGEKPLPDDLLTEDIEKCNPYVDGYEFRRGRFIPRYKCAEIQAITPRLVYAIVLTLVVAIVFMFIK